MTTHLYSTQAQKFLGFQIFIDKTGIFSSALQIRGGEGRFLAIG
jgi:hypothetical protein